MSKIKDCPWYDRGFCKHGKVSDYLAPRGLPYIKGHGCSSYLLGVKNQGCGIV